MLTIDQEKCIQCETCVQECMKGCLNIVDDVTVHDPEGCIMCGHCLAVCPRDAIIIDGDGYDCMDCEELRFTPKPTKEQVRAMIMMRRSVRHYTEREITDKEINAILEAGKYAPTARNTQNNAFVVVKSPEAREELLADTIGVARKLAATGNSRMTDLVGKYDNEDRDGFYFDAPVVIFIFSESDIDGSIAATTMNFAIESMGLGCCMARIPVPVFEDAEFAAKWQAPAGKKCVIALLIGESESEYFCSVPRKNPPTIIK